MFVKGKSGNPSGRPKSIFKVGDAAAVHAADAIRVLAEALTDENVKARIAAAKELLDRAFGKPLTVTADMTNKLDALDDDALDAALAAVREARRARNDAGDGATPETTH